MKARSIWVEEYRSVLDNGRGHSVVVDLPPAQKGGDTGPTALELAVMALAGCVTTIFKIIADKRRFKYDSLKVELDAEKPDGAMTITKIKGEVEVVTEAGEKEAETVLKLTLDNCPVGVLFDKAGVELSWNVVVKKP